MTSEPRGSTAGYAGETGTDDYATSTGTAVPIDVDGGGGTGLVHEAQERAAPIADRVREQTTTQLSTQKDRASDAMTSVADAVRQTADRLREGDQANVAQYADMAADQVERLSTHLRERDLSSLLREAEDVARRQPALVIGGAFVAGLLAARFLKSSNRQQQYAGFEGGAYASSGAAGPWESAAYDATAAYDTPMHESTTTESGSESTGYGDTVYEGATGLGATQAETLEDVASDASASKPKTSGRSRRRRTGNAGS
jgi:hypothetical protein